MWDALTRRRCYSVDLISFGLLKGNGREDQAWTRLGTYGLLEDSVMVSMLELKCNNLMDKGDC